MLCGIGTPTTPVLSCLDLFALAFLDLFVFIVLLVDALVYDNLVALLGCDLLWDLHCLCGRD